VVDPFFIVINPDSGCIKNFLTKSMEKYLMILTGYYLLRALG
jgi:hypothetical protein